MREVRSISNSNTKSKSRSKSKSTSKIRSGKRKSNSKSRSRAGGRAEAEARSGARARSLKSDSRDKHAAFTKGETTHSEILLGVPPLGLLFLVLGDLESLARMRGPQPEASKP